MKKEEKRELRKLLFVCKNHIKSCKRYKATALIFNGLFAAFACLVVLFYEGLLAIKIMWLLLVILFSFSAGFWYKTWANSVVNWEEHYQKIYEHLKSEGKK